MRSLRDLTLVIHSLGCVSHCLSGSIREPHDHAFAHRMSARSVSPPLPPQVENTASPDRYQSSSHNTHQYMGPFAGQDGGFWRYLWDFFLHLAIFFHVRDRWQGVLYIRKALENSYLDMYGSCGVAVCHQKVILGCSLGLHTAPTSPHPLHML